MRHTSHGIRRHRGLGIDEMPVVNFDFESLSDQGVGVDGIVVPTEVEELKSFAYHDESLGTTAVTPVVLKHLRSSLADCCIAEDFFPERIYAHIEHK
mgnify:CR=1 FL=1